MVTAADKMTTGSPEKAATSSQSNNIGLELHVVESAPKHLQMRITTACVPVVVDDPGVENKEEASSKTSASAGRRVVFKVAYSRAKSFLGVVSGSDMETVLTYAADNNNSNNDSDDCLKGIVALVDGGYNSVDQTSPDRTLELVTDEKYGMTVGQWHLPREKHERPLRIDMITGAIKALLSEK